MSVRVRFAPSPTGYLHVGNIRIAALNYIFAKKHSGTFILRIDDTDKVRSTDKCEQAIIDDLKWLNFNWTEFYKQSQRLSLYCNAIQTLKNCGRLYPCYETQEELILKRKTQLAAALPPVYDRSALKLSDSEKIKLEKEGRIPHWRFLLNDGDTRWNDLIHGEVKINSNTISDPILVKPDGSFVYTLASVVDDIDLSISHVIRGADHITNTAVQIQLTNALNGKVPNYGHVPLLSSLDGQDISKRSQSELSIVNLRNAGIEPNAIIFALSQLGTSNSFEYHDTLETFIEKFNFTKISISEPKFDIDSLNFISKKILANYLFDQINPRLSLFNLKNIDENFWNLIKCNIEKLHDVKTWYDVLFERNYDKSSIDVLFCNLMIDCINEIYNDFSYELLIEKLKQSSGKHGKILFHSIRQLLTGMTHGPELKKIIEFLGIDEIKERLYCLLKK